MDLSNCLLSNFCNLIPVRLDNSNYVTWKFLLETMLKGCGLMKYIDGSFPCPAQYMITEEKEGTSETTAEYSNWKQSDYAIMALLAATLSSDVLSFVVGSNSSRELWCLLKERYASTSWFNKEQLKTNFYKLQKGSDSIDKYLDRVKIACDQLANVGIYMTDEDIIVSVLLGLPSDYTTMKTIIRAKHNPVSTQELRSLLLIAEAELEEAKKSISLPSKTEFVAQDDSCRRHGGMHQQYDIHMPQMQANSYMLQQATPSTFSPCLATYGGISQVHNASSPQNSSFLQQSSFSQLSTPYSSSTQQNVYGGFSQPTGFIAQSEGVQKSNGNGIRNGAQSYNGPQQLQGNSQSLKNGFSQRNASTPGETSVGTDFEKMTKFGALVDIGRNVNEKKSETLVGMDSKLQLQIDQAMIDLDKAKKEDELGVNVILAAKIGNEGTMEQPEELEVSSILNTTNGLATIGSVINSRKGKMSKGDGDNANFHIVSSSSDQMKQSTSLSAGSMRPMVRVKQEGQHLIESQLDLTNSSSSLVSQAMELKKVKTMMNCRRACQPMELWPSLPLLPPG